MPNDAKLGLLCGLGIVIAVAVVFFRNEGSGAAPVGEATAAAVGVSKVMPTPASSGSNRSLRAKPTASGDPTSAPRVHTGGALSGEPVSRQEGLDKRMDSQSQTRENDDRQ